MLDDALVELEATLLDHLLRTWVAAIEDWHVVDACHLVDCIHEGHEVVFDVDILLTMGREKDVFLGLEVELIEDGRGLNLWEYLTKDFCHRGANNVGVFWFDT